MKAITINTETIAKLEAAGFKRWTKNGMDRMYINTEKLGLEVIRFNSGNAKEGTWQGAEMYRQDLQEIDKSKVWIDLADGTLHVKTDFKPSYAGDPTVEAVAEAYVNAIFDDEVDEADEAETVEETAETVAESVETDELDEAETIAETRTIHEACQGMHVEDAVQLVESILRRESFLTFSYLNEHYKRWTTGSNGDATTLAETYREIDDELDMIEDWWDALSYCAEEGIDASDSAAFVAVLAMGRED